MDGWRKLEEREYDRVWDRFELDFDFHPSMDPKHWPGIREPAPSITYNIGHIYGHGEAAELEADLDRKTLAAFRKCVPVDGELYALDWKHPGYAFLPHLATPETLRVPVLPNGDYYIFLAPNLRFGVFGHPWEQTICVFGARLVDAMSVDPPQLFSRPARVRPVVP